MVKNNTKRLFKNRNLRLFPNYSMMKIFSFRNSQPRYLILCVFLLVELTVAGFPGDKKATRLRGPKTVLQLSQPYFNELLRRKPVAGDRVVGDRYFAAEKTMFTVYRKHLSFINYICAIQ
jgi:hypothetical protein